MKKYLYGFKMYFLNSFQYRFNMVIGLILGNIGFFIEMLFWGLIYNGEMEKTINGYTLASMITYYFVGGIFRRFIFGSDYMGMIKGGSLGPLLLKPYNLNVSLCYLGVGIIFFILAVAAVRSGIKSYKSASS